MIVLDASVLVALLDESDVHHQAAVSLLSDLSDQDLGMSPISLAETIVGPARSGNLEVALAAISQLEIATIDLGDDAPLRLALLRSNTGLKLPDCCVLLAAEAVGGDVATFDGQLGDSASRLGIVVHPLR